MRIYSSLFTIVLIAMASLVTAQPLTLLQNRDEIEVPFKYKHNFLLVDIRFDGKLPLTFLFDTGAEHTVLFKKSYGDLLGLEYGKRISLYGSDLSRNIYAFIARNVGIQLFPLPSVNQDIIVLDHDFTFLDEMTGTSIDGILGASFFRNMVVEIDYRKGKIFLHDPTDYRPPSRKFRSLPIEIVHGKPYVSGTAFFQNADTAGTKLLLDTGAGLSLLLHSNTHESIQLPEKTISGTLGTGLGGELTGYVGKIDRLQVLSVTFNNVVTSFQDLDEEIMLSSQLVRNGIIGNEILKRFHLIIDFPGERIYLDPRSIVDDKFEFDRSGLTVFAVGANLNEYLIHHVIEGSPADEAGVREGDIILSLQRIPVVFYSLDGISRTFRKEAGKKIRLRVKRGEEKILLEFELRDLI